MDQEFIDKWVVPFYMTGFMRCDVAEFRSALSEVDKPIVAQLLAEENWRPRVVGAWFAGLKQWTEFEETMGTLFLESKLVYAGRGYAFAFACFADDVSRSYLTQYLDHYLRHPELYYDQRYAMCALMWIDAQNGTEYAAPYLVPGGLWDTFVSDKNDAWKLERTRKYHWELMEYCRVHFGDTE